MLNSSCKWTWRVRVYLPQRRRWIYIPVSISHVSKPLPGCYIFKWKILDGSIDVFGRDRSVPLHILGILQQQFHVLSFGRRECPLWNQCCQLRTWEVSPSQRIQETESTGFTHPFNNSSVSPIVERTNIININTKMKFAHEGNKTFITLYLMNGKRQCYCKRQLSFVTKSSVFNFRFVVRDICERSSSTRIKIDYMGSDEAREVQNDEYLDEKNQGSGWR